MRELLSRWAALTPEDQQHLAEHPLRSPDDFIATQLSNLAQAASDLRRVVSTGFEWADIATLQSADRNPEFWLAIVTANGTHREQLVSAATKYLNTVPTDAWLFFLGRQRAAGGLATILRAPTSHLLEVWDILDRLESVELKLLVHLALLTLSNHNCKGFLDLTERIEDLAVLKLIADSQRGVPEFGRHLARSERPLIAALGVHHHLAYLKMIERLADEPLRKFAAFERPADDLESLIEHRRVIKQEVRDSLSDLFEDIGGGPKRGTILAEVLVNSFHPRSSQRGIVDRQAQEIAARTIARWLRAGTTIESQIIEGIDIDPVRGMVVAEAIAAELEDLPTLSKAWRIRLMAHVEKRLLSPPREAFEGTSSSETDPLAPNPLVGEQCYIDYTARALGALNSEVDLVAWFEKKFESLGVLGEGRDRPDSQWWRATSPRLGLLMLIGSRTTQLFPVLGGQIGKILGAEFATRLKEWEWHKRVGYQLSAANGLECEAIQELVRSLPTSELAHLSPLVCSTWMSLLLARHSHNSDGTVENLFRNNFDVDLIVLDQRMLTEVIWLLADLSMWDELERALARYAQARDSDKAGWSRDRMIEIIEALRVIQTDKYRGTALLRSLTDGLPSLTLQELSSADQSLMALRLYCLHALTDASRQRQLAIAEHTLTLLSGST